MGVCPAGESVAARGRSPAAFERIVNQARQLELASNQTDQTVRVRPAVCGRDDGSRRDRLGFIGLTREQLRSASNGFRVSAIDHCPCDEHNIQGIGDKPNVMGTDFVIGTSLAQFDGRRDPEFWEGLMDRVPVWDSMIDDLNAAID